MSSGFINIAKKVVCKAVGIWVFLSAVSGFAAQNTLHHDLEVEILNLSKTLRGKDTIHLPKGMSLLRVVLKPGVRILHVEGAVVKRHNDILTLTMEKADRSSKTVVLSYEGFFDDPFEAEPFSMDNPGQGVMGTITQDSAFFLAGSGWYPWVIEDIPQTYRVSVTAPKGIYAVMEGRLESHTDKADQSISIWSVKRPSGPLAMFAGRYVVSERMHDKIRIATYFFPDNAMLSKRYLDAVERHISRYEELHGPYPFSKFSVVENFFPTGYGFPSYTLLGSRVLRLPFIPGTSLRHEVAHCWWGNGVFTDIKEGNWAEGLTTYVADYLLKEEQSESEARGYRLRTLEKYALLAAGEKDFALSKFRSRKSPASQAIGYGKAMFVFHMMRQQIGDAPFWAALRDVYTQRLFKQTGWGHFMNAFARHGNLSQQEIQTFYDQWITRPGALQLAMEKPRVDQGEGQITVAGILRQKPPVFDVDVKVELIGSTIKKRKTVSIRKDMAAFSIRVQESPQNVAADPDFDVFRLLYPEEIPATVNAVKGSDSLVAVIAQNTPAGWERIFQGLLAGLNQRNRPVWSEKKFAAEDTTGKDILFFGMPELKKGRHLFSGLGDQAILSADGFQVGEKISSQDADTLFSVFKSSQRLVAIFLPKKNTDVKTVLRTARKITHYGRYGQLSFKDSNNVEKGVGKTSGSPLRVDVEKE